MSGRTRIHIDSSKMGMLSYWVASMLVGIFVGTSGPVNEAMAGSGFSSAPKGRPHDPRAWGCDDGNPCTTDMSRAVDGRRTCVNVQRANCVQCGSSACVFPDAGTAYESWGPATAITAERFPWSEDAVRVIIPLGDEGPCNGNFPDGCNEDGDDGESVTNAIAIANRYEVVVSPITGTNSNQCVISLASRLAAGTGGISLQLHNALAELPGALGDIVMGACPSCALVDLVIVMDTSGSMGDEAFVLCSGLAQVMEDLANAGVTVNATVLGIAEAPGGLFSCLSGDVVDRFGGEVTNACDDENPCTTSDRCVEGVCGGTWIGDCVPCALDGDCDDGDACTQDFCDAGGVCAAVPNFDDAAYCCNPTTQELTPLDDGDPCTDAVCDPATGSVDYPPGPAGTPCDDEQICTADDTCNGEGICVGRDFESIACASDTGCFESLCDEQAGHCICADEPTLCLTPDRADCYNEGDVVQVNIELGYGLHTISDGQFSIAYDPAVLSFVSIAPGDSVAVEPPFVESPFSMETLRVINEVEGTILYSVGVDSSDDVHGTRGPAVMATVRFRAVVPCSSTDLCFLDDPSRPTLLTNDEGFGVSHVPCCTGEILVANAPPTIVTCPADISVNADAGSFAASVTWDSVNAVGGCGGPVEVDCDAVYLPDPGVAIELLGDGGLFPSGMSEVRCTATDSCNQDSDECVWRVDVSSRNTVRFEVELAPPIAAAANPPLQRCIEFELFSNCLEEPLCERLEVDFGVPFNVNRHGWAEIEVDAGVYIFASARDPLHTLRSVTEVQIEGNMHVARFTVDPSWGGRWLIGGNLVDSEDDGNGNSIIDLLDWGAWNTQNGLTLDPNTPCPTEPCDTYPCCSVTGRHADINGDGAVDVLDYSIIEQNWGMTDEPVCSQRGKGLRLSSPITEISIDELGRMGLGDLSGADVNGDGLLNLEDIELYRKGYTAKRAKATRLPESP